jgi:proline iminopeptidase
MRKALLTIGKIILGIIGLLVILAVAGFVLTSGDYEVAETVEQDPTIPHVTLDGVTFHAETFGDPANPTVIVIHGGPGGDYRYLLSLQALADEFYVVFYDQRGTGLSPRVDPAEITLESSLADLDAIVEHYGEGEPVHLIGHSWGAMLASGYIGLHPEKVDRVVLAEPGALTNEHMTRFLELQRSIQDVGFMAKATQITFQGMHVNGPDEQARGDYISGTIAHTWAADPENGYNCPDSDYESPYWRWGSQALNHIIGAATNEEGVVDVSLLSENADRFTDKVLFVASECNTWIGVEWQKEQMALFPNAEMVVIPDAGHEMFTENPAASIPPVRAYLEE